MERNFEFLRKLIKFNSYDYALNVFKSLSNEGLELFVEKDDNDIEFKLVVSDDDLINKSELYVAAADRLYAIEILKAHNLTEGLYLEEIKIKNTQKKDDFEKALRKRKWTMLEALVIIFFAAIFYILRSIF